MEKDDFEFYTITHDNNLFSCAQEVRNEVFIKEQKITPEDEYDDIDNYAIHVVCINKVNKKPVGTLRIFEENGWGVIGRVAVLSEYRGQRLAFRMLEKALEIIRKKNIYKIWLHAQTDKSSLYYKFGFKPIGEEFIEAGIMHIKMIRTEDI